MVNKLHLVGFVTSLWLGVTQRITNEISNFVTCSNNPPQKHFCCKKRCVQETTSICNQGRPEKLRGPGQRVKVGPLTQVIR